MSLATRSCPDAEPTETPKEPKAPSPVRPGSGQLSGMRSEPRQCARAPPSISLPPPLLRLRLQPPGCTGPRGLSNRPISSPQRFLRAPFKSRAQARRLGYRSGSGVRGSSGDSGVALCRGAVRGPRGGGYSLARSGEAEGGLQAEDPRLEAQPGRSGCPGPVPPFGPASGGAGPEASGPRGGGSWAAVVVASAGLAVSP